MSKKLQRAVQSGTVIVRNKISGEVSITYMLVTGERKTEKIPPFGTVEFCPRLTSANLLKHGNIDEAVAKGWVSIQ